MSIKLGTKKDLRKICHLPTDVQNAIRDDVEALECFYGEGRVIDSDMGGFVVVCGADEDVCIQNFEEDLSKAEFVEEISPFVKALYISGTERNIIIYRRKKEDGQT